MGNVFVCRNTLWLVLYFLLLYDKWNSVLLKGDRCGSDVYYSLKQGRRLERPSRCPLFIYQIMLKCWEWDEEQRPTFYQLVQLLKKDYIDQQLNNTSRKSFSIFDEITNDQKNAQYRTDGNDHESKQIIHF
jgi:hypothetical protein